MNEGCDPTAEIRADDYSESIILQRDEPVLLPYRSRRGFHVADVGIDTIGIACRRDRTGGGELVREDVILEPRSGAGRAAPAARSASPAFAGPFGRRPGSSPQPRFV